MARQFWMGRWADGVGNWGEKGATKVRKQRLIEEDWKIDCVRHYRPPPYRVLGYRIQPIRSHIDFQISKLFCLGCISDMSKNSPLYLVKTSVIL